MAAELTLSDTGRRLDLAARTRSEADRRALLFRETPAETARRWVLGLAYALQPSRIGDVPFLLLGMGVDALRGGTRIPEPDRTLSRPDTFGGICRDISPETILEAGRRGFYPWCHIGPLKWWTRAERMVLLMPEHHIAKRFRPMMKKSSWRVTFDTAFDEVIRACAEPRSNRGHALTWITPQIMRLYAELHRQGHAHSVEVWDEAGRLIGGGYGLAVGRVFITESQFFREPNASKMGYHVLNHHLAKWGFALNDNKGWTDATEKMGFRLIPRAAFEALLAEHAHAPLPTGTWKVEDDIRTVGAAA
jgi:leucyl/phenylalanyl-tRNA--protein transferase